MAEAERTHLRAPVSPPPLPPARCPSCGSPWPDGQLFCPADGALCAAGAVVGGRYELTQLLGKGGMGMVFAARHTLLGKGVAVKILRADFTRDADQVARFLREAQLCSQLSHDHIVNITDFGRDERGLLYLVMELLSGTTLFRLLDEQGPMPAERAIPILQQLCRALACAHQAGVVHRDLTPRNVLLTEPSGRRDVVKLLDFGISRLAGGEDRVTSTGIPVGTTPYMPPEQLRGELVQDHRVDLYALGVIACELLTGDLPFQAQTPAQLIAEKLSGDPVSVALPQLARLPRPLGELVARCLSADPARRPVSAQDVEERLAAAGAVVGEVGADLAGTRAGSYRLVRRLGSGGLGAVWLGEHPVIGSRVAVKVLHPQMCQNAEAVRRFVVEAQAVNRIDSPHIVKIFDFGKLPDGRDYAVMELLEGESLGQRLRRQGPLPWEAARTITLQVLRALSAAHAAGIVHRDLKPDNVHLGGVDGRLVVKVLDFGIAKLLAHSGSAAHQTELGIGIGTPLYAAPEQIAGEEIGPAADVYALGALLFEVLAGRPPFVGSTSDVLTAKLTRVAPSLPGQVAGLPPAVAQALGRMLDRAASGRPSPEELASLLAGAEVGGGGPRAVLDLVGALPRSLVELSEAPTLLTPLPARVAQLTRRWWVLAAIGGGLALVGVVLAWSLSGGSSARQPRSTEPVRALVSRPRQSEPALVEVTSIPAGATVLLEGEPVGKTPMRLRLPRGLGAIEVELRKPGFVTTRTALDPAQQGPLLVRLNESEPSSTQRSYSPPVEGSKGAGRARPRRGAKESRGSARGERWDDPFHVPARSKAKLVNPFEE